MDIIKKNNFYNEALIRLTAMVETYIAVCNQIDNFNEIVSLEFKLIDCDNYCNSLFINIKRTENFYSIWSTTGKSIGMQGVEINSKNPTNAEIMTVCGSFLNKLDSYLCNKN